MIINCLQSLLRFFSFSSFPLQVMLDLMDQKKEELKGWLNSEIEIKSSIREVEEHYYGQLTKSEIRELYEKYKVDHELFGFSPDYYIALGQDD